MDTIQSENHEDELIPETDDAPALPPKQELALQAVISHHTLKEAALAAGISETTLWRYMKDEAFARRLTETRRESVNHAVIHLQGATSDAVKVLHDMINKETAPASARITAARTIIDFSIRVVEMNDLKKRIGELEDFLRAKEEEEEVAAAMEEDGGDV